MCINKIGSRKCFEIPGVHAVVDNLKGVFIYNTKNLCTTKQSYNIKGFSHLVTEVHT
jgi:hypothetical protein